MKNSRALAPERWTMRKVKVTGSRRGGTLVLVAVSMVALLGMAGMVIDIGMLLKVRGEAQRAADAAALGGASAFLLSIGRAAESTQVVTRARQLADTNYMAGQHIDSLSEVTVTVIYDSQKVRVKVRRAVVPVWFARIFGMDAFPVGAEAAAVADYAGGALCTKPIAILDIWDDQDDDPNNNHLVDPSEDWEWDPGDIYGRYDPSFTPPQTGYGTDLRGVSRDWGRQLFLRDQGNSGATQCLDANGNKCLRPGYWALWGLPGEIKTPDIRAAMATCRTNSAFVDTAYQIHTGEISSVVGKPIEDAWDADPTAQWDPAAIDSVTGRTGSIVSVDFPDWRQSPRAWIMGLFDPAEAPTKVNTTIAFNNFALFFFEGCSKDGGVTLEKKCTPQHDLYGRYMGLAQGSGPGGGTLTRILRLVE
jgi:hypothetical protein